MAIRGVGVRELPEAHTEPDSNHNVRGMPRWEGIGGEVVDEALPDISRRDLV